MEILAPGRVCKNPACGKAFAPRGGGQTYCCTQCKDRAKKENNREAYAEYARKWRAANPEKAAERRRRQRARNPEPHRRCKRRWGAKHPEKRGRRRRAKRAAFRKLAFLWKLERIMSEVDAAGERQAVMDIERARAEVHTWDTDRLKEELAQGLRVVRERLLTLAAVLAELDARGEDVAGDRHLLGLLRKIGSGELLVDAVVRFAGRPSVMASVAAMPVTEQERVMGETDEEVEEHFRNRKQAARPAPAARPHRQAAHLPTMADLGKSGTVKDVAQLCLDIIGASADPPAVAELLLPRLQELKQSRQKRGARPA